MNCYMPVKYISGEGCVVKNAALLAALGKRCLIVSGKGSAKKCGALSDALKALEGVGVNASVFDEISPNPLLSDCVRAGKAASERGADFILGIGGGSAMDAAKAVSVFASNPELSEDDFYAKRWPNAPKPIALIGTTAGTGSEVTMVSVLTDSKRRKHSIHDERLYARAAFGDSAYTRFLSREQTLSTGIDVLCHAAESYFSKKATELSKAYSVRAVRLLLAPMQRAASEDMSGTDRESMLEASILAGLAINITGTCFPHNLGYYLTERFGVPHGFACAAFLRDLFEYEEKVNPKTYGTFFDECATNIGIVCKLTDNSLDLNVQINTGELNEILPRWENNGSVKNTLGDVTVNDVRRFFNKFVVEE